ncbi:hypothetical protein HYH03_011161 [Edaphochlamys debaryana]|uniref:Ubiquinone biosynthesis protein COQ4 homolog, mitochondrial n=1 Tax=Edaphochlamys debaryana TaxID=47281 RepID=A0A836BWQ3_9CHLO|nr:hypothetical protein HYH03_011161 [Edaphochlamys debaryana]|eukprot:KAG2490359.1 hypothetical protein HYH03_011161 [Edaphochlamys debaryana]
MAPSRYAPLYPTHIPLNPLQKGALAVLSCVGALWRPARADLVAAVGETTGEWLLPYIRDRMKRDPVGRRILEERPRVTDETMASSAGHPPGTFGHAYAAFMGDRRFHANDRTPVRFIDDEELAYVIARSREVHDFWHVLFDLHTNVFGEVALKGLEFVQTGLPMTGLAVVGAQYKLSPQDRELLQKHYLPWALRAGGRCHDLMSIYYEEHFGDDLEELRRRFRIIPAPPPPQHLAFKGAPGQQKPQPQPQAALAPSTPSPASPNQA